MDIPHAREQLLQNLCHVFSEQIPFNRYLGLEVLALDDPGPRLRLAMRDELVGNFTRGSLHGGAISTMLDVTGALAAFLGMIEKMSGRATEEIMQQFTKLGTIDLRVDYLRPGTGSEFIATGYVQRTGHKVSVTRMELHDDRERLVATGTGAYVIS